MSYFGQSEVETIWGQGHTWTAPSSLSGSVSFRAAGVCWDPTDRKPENHLLDPLGTRKHRQVPSVVILRKCGMQRKCSTAERWFFLDWLSRLLQPVQLLCVSHGGPQEREHWNRSFHHGHHVNDRKHSRSGCRNSALRPDVELFGSCAVVSICFYDSMGCVEL